MMQEIVLSDFEDDCDFVAIVDPESTGVEIEVKDMFGDTVNLVFDARLMKKFCQLVSKAIQTKSQSKNYCGEVYAVVIQNHKR